jgi:hypothetical protein
LKTVIILNIKIDTITTPKLKAIWPAQGILQGMEVMVEDTPVEETMSMEEALTLGEVQPVDVATQVLTLMAPLQVLTAVVRLQVRHQEPIIEKKMVQTSVVEPF